MCGCDSLVQHKWCEWRTAWNFILVCAALLFLRLRSLDVDIFCSWFLRHCACSTSLIRCFAAENLLSIWLGVASIYSCAVGANLASSSDFISDCAAQIAWVDSITDIRQLAVPKQRTSAERVHNTWLECVLIPVEVFQPHGHPPLGCDSLVQHKWCEWRTAWNFILVCAALLFLRLRSLDVDIFCSWFLRHCACSTSLIRCFAAENLLSIWLGVASIYSCAVGANLASSSDFISDCAAQIAWVDSITDIRQLAVPKQRTSAERVHNTYS